MLNKKHLQSCQTSCTFSKVCFDVFLQEKDTRIFAIGIGEKISNDELEEITDHKKQNVFHVDKFEDLTKNLDEFLEVACKA